MDDFATYKIMIFTIKTRNRYLNKFWIKMANQNEQPVYCFTVFNRASSIQEGRLENTIHPLQLWMISPIRTVL